MKCETNFEEMNEAEQREYRRSIYLDFMEENYEELREMFLSDDIEKAAKGEILLERPSLIALRKTEVSLARGGCVYFLWDEDSIVYVGQSKLAVARVSQHLLEGKKRFDAVSVLPVKMNNLDRLEHQYIKKYAPKYNSTGLSGEEQRQRKVQELEIEKGIYELELDQNPDAAAFFMLSYPKIYEKRQKLSV